MYTMSNFFKASVGYSLNIMDIFRTLN